MWFTLAVVEKHQAILGEVWGGSSHLHPWHPGSRHVREFLLSSQGHSRRETSRRDTPPGDPGGCHGQIKICMAFVVWRKDACFEDHSHDFRMDSLRKRVHRNNQRFRSISPDEDQVHKVFLLGHTWSKACFSLDKVSCWRETVCNREVPFLLRTESIVRPQDDHDHTSPQRTCCRRITGVTTVPTKEAKQSSTRARRSASKLWTQNDKRSCTWPRSQHVPNLPTNLPTNLPNPNTNFLGSKWDQQVPPETTSQ